MKVTCFPLLAMLLTSGWAEAQTPAQPIVITLPIIPTNLPPQRSVCESDYRQNARQAYQNAMDAIDHITPQLTDARIAEFEQEEVKLGTMDHSLWRQPDYVALQIRRSSPILAYARDHIGEVDFRDSDHGQFFQLRGDIELLLSVQRTVNTLIVLQGKADVAEPGSVSAKISLALETLLDVARCNTKLGPR